MRSEEPQVPERVFVLAAGRGNQADGMAKCLIRHPRTRATVLDHVIDAFVGKKVSVVVGFRAIQIMDHYPQLDFVINEHWADTGNAMSLGLALGEEPAYVVPGDVFLDRALVEELDHAAPDAALVSRRENRIPTAIHGVLDDRGLLRETYQGPVRNMSHPELLGLFKVTSQDLLQSWQRRAVQGGHQFAALTLPLEPPAPPMAVVDVGQHTYDEVNTPADYLRLIEGGRNQ